MFRLSFKSVVCLFFFLLPLLPFPLPLPSLLFSSFWKLSLQKRDFIFCVIMAQSSESGDAFYGAQTDV